MSTTDRTIVQYRAMGSRRTHFSVVGVYKIPRTAKVHGHPTRKTQSVRLRRWDYDTLQWGLTRSKALIAANALNTLNNLPLQEK